MFSLIHFFYIFNNIFRNIKIKQNNKIEKIKKMILLFYINKQYVFFIIIIERPSEYIL